MTTQRRSTVKPAAKVQKQKSASYVEKTTTAAKPAREAEQESPARGAGRRKRRVVREPLSTRITVSLRDLMYDYEQDTGTGVQAMVEEALTEYLATRGYGVSR